MCIRDSLKRAELLCDHQRRVVWQHDTTGPHPDRPGASRNMSHHQRRRRRSDPRHVVMFGQPKAVIALGFGMTGKVQRIGKGLSLIHI